MQSSRRHTLGLRAHCPMLDVGLPIPSVCHKGNDLCGDARGRASLLLWPLPSPIRIPYATVIESLRPIRPYIQATLNAVLVPSTVGAFLTFVQ